MSPRRVVVVGGGGSGLPLAARLAAQGHDVVVLEAGPVASPAQDAWTVRRALPGAPLTWTYRTELRPGRPWRIARGRLLGGSTAVNAAYFQRPHPDDFARWAGVAGDAWSYRACLPALRRLETDRDLPDDPVHGSSGPVPVTRAGADPLTAGFLAAARTAGAAVEADKNGGGPSGAGLLPRNAVGGERYGVDRAYGPLLRAASVEIRTATPVRRVRFRRGRAVGVEVFSDGAATFVAADEVVLAAGAIETPRLLLRSGIGDAATRDPAVRPVADRRGVGRGLSDHAAIDLPWRLHPGAALGDSGAAYTAAWNAPAGTVAGLAVEYLLAALPTAVIVSGDRTATGPLGLRVTLAQPLSRGAVARDGLIRYGYLADPRERDALRAAAAAGVALLRSPQLADLVAGVDAPTAPDDVWVEEKLVTSLHTCGTARMGDAADPDAVADAHGRVHGVARLRIADASLLPDVPSRGTALAAVMIGERIAELMATE